MAQNSTRARQYSVLKMRLVIVQVLLTAAFLVLMLFSQAGLLLKQLAVSATGNFYLQLGLYLLEFGAVYYLLFVGLDFYSGFVLERRFGLSRQSLGAWLKQSLRKTFLLSLAALAAAELFYLLLRNFPNTWPLPATALWVLIAVTLGKIAPIVIIPLLYKCVPLTDKELERNLLNLSRKFGVPVKRVFEVQLSTDTEKANAAVAGMGKSRRILLADTLLRNFSNEEIEAVFGHELAHIALQHWLKLTVFGTAVSLATFYLTYLVFRPAVDFLGFDAVHDLAAFPLLVLILTSVTLVLIPLQNIYLRYLEKRADLLALSRVPAKEGFISAMKKLAGQNLSDPSPAKAVEFLFYTHPPISERIRYAAAFGNKQNCAD